MTEESSEALRSAVFAAGFEKMAAILAPTQSFGNLDGAASFQDMMDVFLSGGGDMVANAVNSLKTDGLVTSSLYNYIEEPDLRIRQSVDLSLSLQGSLFDLGYDALLSQDNYQGSAALSDLVYSTGIELSIGLDGQGISVDTYARAEGTLHVFEANGVRVLIAGSHAALPTGAGDIGTVSVRVEFSPDYVNEELKFMPEPPQLSGDEAALTIEVTQQAVYFSDGRITFPSDQLSFSMGASAEFNRQFSLIGDSEGSLPLWYRMLTDQVGFEGAVKSTWSVIPASELADDVSVTFQRMVATNGVFSEGPLRELALAKMGGTYQDVYNHIQDQAHIPFYIPHMHIEAMWEANLAQWGHDFPEDHVVNIRRSGSSEFISVKVREDGIIQVTSEQNFSQNGTYSTVTRTTLWEHVEGDTYLPIASMNFITTNNPASETLAGRVVTRNSVFLIDEDGNATEYNDSSSDGIRFLNDVVKTYRCFGAGTKISMFDGTFKSIEDLSIGDVVKSMGNKGDVMKPIPGLVTQVFSSKQNYVLNYFETNVTPAHPYLTILEDGEKVYRPIMDILLSDGVIIHESGQIIRACTNISIDHWVDCAVTVRGFDIETSSVLGEGNLRLSTPICRRGDKVIRLFELLGLNASSVNQPVCETLKKPLYWMGEVPKQYQYILDQSGFDLPELISITGGRENNWDQPREIDHLINLRQT